MGLMCERPIRAVICTASDAEAARLQQMLLRWACGACVTLSTDRTDSLAEAERLGADLLLLDMDSVELPERSRSEKEKAGLIVISRDAGRVIHSYRWHPAAFLKPDFDAARLAEALLACARHWEKGRLCLESPYRRRTFRLPLGRIRYVEAAAHYCLFNQGRQTLRIRYSINELEPLLPQPPFVRCHRSYLVHLDAVESMSYTTVTLRDGARLPLGRTYVKPLREALQTWQGEGKHHDDLHSDM